MTQTSKAVCAVGSAILGIFASITGYVGVGILFDSGGGADRFRGVGILFCATSIVSGMGSAVLWKQAISGEDK